MRFPMPVTYSPRRVSRTSPALMPVEDAVVIRSTKNGSTKMADNERAVDITCPNADGLACEIMRLIFEFGLTVTKGDLIADGFWCFVTLHVMGRTESKQDVKWELLKERLEAACPSPRRYIMPCHKPPSKKRDMHLLKVCTPDCSGLLNDVAQTLWELEFTIHRVNVSTCPDGQAVDLLFITDESDADDYGGVRDRGHRRSQHFPQMVRDELPNPKRSAEVCEQVREELKDPKTTVELTRAGPECGVFSSLDCSPASRMMRSVAETLFPDGWETPTEKRLGLCVDETTVNIDNSMSENQTMVEIDARDRRGLMYDCMRILKDLKLKVAIGRIVTRETGWCNIVVFVQTHEESQIMIRDRQQEIVDRLKRELLRPIRLDVVTQRETEETELLIATPIEVMSGKGRPRVLYDVTLALRSLRICVFKADITRHDVKNKLWEVYRFVLTDLKGNPVTGTGSNEVKERVRHVLLGETCTAGLS